MKKLIALLLAFSVCLSGAYFKAPLFADTTEKITLAKAYNGDPNDHETLYYKVNNNEITIEEVEAYVIDILGNEKTSAKLNYVLNPYVYAKYKVVAYTDSKAINEGIAGLTSRGGISQDTKTDQGEDEYRYLGYNKTEETKITNDFFPADSKTVSDATQRTWIENDPKLESWDNYKTNENDYILNYLLEQELLNDDDKNGVFKTVTYSVASLTGKTDYIELMKYPKLLQTPSFGKVGQMQLAHIVNGQKWYDTVRKDQFLLNLSTNLEPHKSHVYVKQGDGIIDIKYTVENSIVLQTDNVSEDGYYIKKVTINSLTSSNLYENIYSENKPLPILNVERTKKFDTTGMIPGEKRKVGLDSSTVVETQDSQTFTKGDSKEIIVEMVNTDVTDFVIKRNLTDVTDSVTKLDTLNFATPLTLTLDCESVVMTGNITGRLWEVETDTGWQPIDSGNNEIITYDIDSSTKAFLDNGKINFRLTLVTDSGIVQERQAVHFTGFEEKTSGTSGDVVAVETSDAEYDEEDDEYFVMEGEVLWLKGYKSYHLNELDIIDYDFDIGEEEGDAILIDKRDTKVRIFYPKAYGGTVFKPKLTVEDEVGATDTDQIRVNVAPAEFKPELIMTGTFKENRKLHFKVKNEHSRLDYYPINKSSLVWTIEPLDGQSDPIRIDHTGFEADEFDILFKEKGRYSVTVSGYIHSDYNPEGYYGELTEIINITEDFKPVTDYATSNIMIRDIENDNRTILKLTDTSYSIDDDPIVQRIWSYRFDSDNDQQFEDEDRVIMSVANERYVELLTDNQVGRYKFELQTKEEFGQDTIPVFITDLDKRRGDTSSKSDDDKIVWIKNVAPVIEFDITKRKPVNLLIYEDFTEVEQVEIEEALNQLQVDLLEKKLVLNVAYVEPSINLGSKNYKKVYYDTFITIRVGYEGDDEDNDDIRGVDSIRLRLNSVETYGELNPAQSTRGRFEVISCTISDSELDLGLDCGTDRFSKWFDKYYLITVTYKDNGNLRTATYKYISDFEYYTHYSNVERERDYDEVTLRSATLIEDYPNTGDTWFARFDTTLTSEDWIIPEEDLNRHYDRYDKDIVVFDEHEVLEKMDAMEGDTYFVTLLKNKDGLLGLSDRIVDYTRDNKVKYRAGDEGFLANNMLNFKGLTDVEVRNGKTYLIADKEVYLFDTTNDMFSYYGVTSDFYDKTLPQFKVEPYESSETGSDSEVLSYYYDGPYYIFEGRIEVDKYYKDRYLGEDPYNYIEATYGDYGRRYSFVPFKHRDKLYYCGVQYKAAYDWKADHSNAWEEKPLNDARLWIDDTGVNQISDTNYVGFWTKEAWLTSSGVLDIYGQYWDERSVRRNWEKVEGKKRTYYEHEEDWYIERKMKKIFSINEGPNNISFIKTSDDYYYVYTRDKKLVRYDKENGKRVLITDGWQDITIENEIIQIDQTTFKYRERQFDAVSEIKVYKDVVYSLGVDGTLYRDDMVEATHIKDLVGIDSKGLVYLTESDQLIYPDGTMNSVASAAYNDNLLFVVYKDGVMKYASNASFTFSGDVSKLGMTYRAVDFDTSHLISSIALINISAENAYYDTVAQTLNSIFEDYKDYSTSEKMYALLGEEINMATTMFDYEDDPYYENSMRIDSDHVDPYFFENSLGRDPGVGEGKAIKQFDYVGHYKVMPKVRDNPVGEDDHFDDFRLWNADNTYMDIYVHRRPIAKMTYGFTEEASGLAINLLDAGSYDIDHESQSNKGIRRYKWQVKKATDNSWTTYFGQSVAAIPIEAGVAYVLSLRVQDEEFAWSKPVMTTFDIDSVPLIVEGLCRSQKTYFSLDGIPINESILLTDLKTIYPGQVQLEYGLYDGNTLVSPLEILAFEEGVTGQLINELTGEVQWQNQLLEVPDELADGDYVLRIRGRSVADPQKTGYIDHDVEVLTPIEPEPELVAYVVSGEEVTLKCDTSIYTDGLNVEVFQGTPFAETLEMTRTERHGQGAEEKQGWSLLYKVPETVSPAVYQIKFLGTVDTNPAKQEVATLSVQVIPLGIELVTIEGAWNHWRGQEDLFGERLPDMPYRFLSWEKIYLTAQTVGDPDEVFMRLSPELEAMAYTDGNGKTFYYEDYFGDIVTFPLQFSKIRDNEWHCSYILPLAPSSLSFDDERLLPPYELIVTAKKGALIQEYRFDEEEGRGIELTGNTTNLIYTQPMPNRDQ